MVNKTAHRTPISLMQRLFLRIFLLAAFLYMSVIVYTELHHSTPTRTTLNDLMKPPAERAATKAQIYADETRRKAEAGDAEAQIDLAYLYQNGNGVTPDAAPDMAAAAQWFFKAAAQDNTLAQSDLGVLYVQGQGVRKDYAQGARWLQKAADKNYAPAQVNLGLLYERGTGVTRDYKQAALLFQKAAMQKLALGQYQLGRLYNEGTGVKQDYGQAADLFREAADHGNVAAQTELGLLYMQGHGVKKDNEQAYLWLSIAGRSGDAKACDVLKKLKPRLKPAQVRRMTQAAEAWEGKPDPYFNNGQDTPDKDAETRP